MNPIQQKAKEIKDGRLSEQEKASADFHRIRNAQIAQLLNEFEIGFSNELQMLKDSGIDYSAHYNSAYEHQGTYIRFISEEGKVCKMDFDSRNSYRYEYIDRSNPSNNERYGRMTFGNWPKEDFFIFIDQQLFSK